VTASCLVCGSPESVPVGRQAGYDVALCTDCRVLYVTPQPDAAEISRAYATGSLIEDNGTERRDPDGAVQYPRWKRNECGRIAGELARLSRGRRLLDVGCLWGLFLESARARGFEVTGAEPWSEAASYCKERLGLRVLNGSLEDVCKLGERYDAITLLDVVEHSPDPAAMTGIAARLLAPGGLLCIGTPNVDGLIPRLSRLKRRLRGQASRYLSPPPPFHLFGFNRSSLCALLSRAGLRPERIRTLSSIDTVGASVPRPRGQATALHLLSLFSKLAAAGDRMLVYARLGEVPRQPPAAVPAGEGSGRTEMEA